MNTKAPMWLEYIAHYTLPQAVSPVLAIVPKQAPQPVTAPILCAVRLAPRTYYYGDGRQETREQFSHRIHEFAGYSGEFVLLKTVCGVIGRRVNDVRGLPVMAEKAA